MKPTLGQVLVLSFLALAGVLGLVFIIVLRETRETIMASSERIREQASREIGERVTGFLQTAPEALASFQQQLALDLVSPDNPASVEAALFALLLAEKDIGEITFSRADQTGFDPQGAIELAPTPRWQFSVVRSTTTGNEESLWSRRVYQKNAGFLADRRVLKPGSAPSATPEAEVAASDPTSHLTFATPARREYQGELLWSDLHWSELDASRPEEERAVEVSVQQSVVDSSGRFAGVVRVGLLTEQLDRAVLLKLTSSNEADPHRIFLSDRAGRLVTRGMASDKVKLFGDDLRLAPSDLAPEIIGALADPKLRSIDDEKAPVASGHFRQNGKEYLTTFRALPGTQDWLVGIVVPREFYLGKLVTIRNHLLVVLSAIMLLIAAGAVAILQSIKRALEQVSRESLKMNAFEFSPAVTSSAFRDVDAVLNSLEMAKAAMRAMSKYVPVDLVRKLYCEKSEPTLGSELLEISIMFSDIKGFTSLSEKLAPNQLAHVLGLYLEELSGIIQRETHGTIDKYIGDAIMTIWNAPEPVPEHPRMACLAALRCCQAADALARTPDWRGLPEFHTRFGLHCAAALVGHFGARDRMNYTAIGDAINLASRLEALNKQYGTSIIASQSIVERVGDAFAFRLLDLVAVKGKSDAIKIYELLGAKGDATTSRRCVDTYEAAFTTYLARDFPRAITLLQQNEGDGPSTVLRERCEAFLHTPPPADWQGVYVPLSK